jgi:hypothetical protein
VWLSGRFGKLKGAVMKRIEYRTKEVFGKIALQITGMEGIERGNFEWTCENGITIKSAGSPEWRHTTDRDSLFLWGIGSGCDDIPAWIDPDDIDRVTEALDAFNKAHAEPEKEIEERQAFLRNGEWLCLDDNEEGEWIHGLIDDDRFDGFVCKDGSISATPWTPEQGHAIAVRMRKN